LFVFGADCSLVSKFLKQTRALVASFALTVPQVAIQFGHTKKEVSGASAWPDESALH